MDELSLMLGNNIRRLRKQHKLKQTELAVLIYSSNNSISAWERGVNQPTAYFLKKLSEVFGCTIDDLFKE